MKKKIGIITFHNAYNYGAMLQAMALQDYLSKENDAYIVNYKSPVIEGRYKYIDFSKKGIKNFIINLCKIAFIKRINGRKKAFINFSSKYYKLTETFNGDEDLKKNYPKFDCYITGSDQVWNPQITNGVSDIYTLNFLEDGIKRISYAASFGITKFTDDEIKLLKEKISKFDSISVRETSALSTLEKITDKKAYEVLDPTLLVTRDYWLDKLENANLKTEKEKYILAYQLDENEEYVKIVNFLSKKLGYKVIHFNGANKYYDKPLRSAYTDGPLDFINLIKNAEFTVMTSFHGTVFSTLFHKQFLVIPNKGNGSRMVDFLTKLGLEDRLIYNFSELTEEHYSKKIDFENADKILECERTKSIAFLNGALK